MLVKFLENKSYSPNGYDTKDVKAGFEGEIEDHFAKAFIDQGICEEPKSKAPEKKVEVKPEPKKEEKPKAKAKAKTRKAKK